MSSPPTVSVSFYPGALASPFMKSITKAFSDALSVPLAQNMGPSEKGLDWILVFGMQIAVEYSEVWKTVVRRALMGSAGTRSDSCGVSVIPA